MTEIHVMVTGPEEGLAYEGEAEFGPRTSSWG
jgi:hypothetical protein